MFDTYAKYGLEEDGMFSRPDIDAEMLSLFIKSELADDEDSENNVLPSGSSALKNKSSEGQEMLPMPAIGANTPISNIPFDVPDTLPGRPSGYTQALKELLNGFSKKYV